jgi:hypothetical protein
LQQAEVAASEHWKLSVVLVDLAAALGARGRRIAEVPGHGVVLELPWRVADDAAGSSSAISSMNCCAVELSALPSRLSWYSQFAGQFRLG